jgi:uncharacterized tellurite resistance protein B-like protein
MKEHIETITNLLLGAAYADKRLEGQEVKTILAILAKLHGTKEAPEARLAQMKTFNPAKFNPQASAATIGGLSADQKHKVLELVAAVNEADDVLDLDEDAYLRKVARGLGLSDDEISDLTLDVDEDEDWAQYFDE